MSKLQGRRLDSLRHKKGNPIPLFVFLSLLWQGKGMSKLSIKDVGLHKKAVFVCVAFKLPLEGNQVADQTRISAAIPTIRYAIYKNAKVILASHLGRPKGQRNAKYSLAPVALKLSALLEQPVTLAEDCTGAETAETVAARNPGEVVLLENLRFHPEEEANDGEFSRQLA